jgi:hypothetical protein
MKNGWVMGYLITVYQSRMLFSVELRERYAVR